MSSTTRQEHIAHLNVGVSGVSGTIAPPNNNRRYLMIQNDSSGDVYIKLGTPAIMNTGIRLPANGGSYILSEMYGNLYTGIVTGIAAASGTILTTEGS